MADMYEGELELELEDEFHESELEEEQEGEFGAIGNILGGLLGEGEDEDEVGLGELEDEDEFEDELEDEMGHGETGEGEGWLPSATWWAACLAKAKTNLRVKANSRTSLESISPLEAS